MGQFITKEEKVHSAVRSQILLFLLIVYGRKCRKLNGFSVNDNICYMIIKYSYKIDQMRIVFKIII